MKKKYISTKKGLTLIIFLSLITGATSLIFSESINFNYFLRNTVVFTEEDFLSDEIYCDNLYIEIKADLERKNHCEEDGDCKSFLVGEIDGTECFYFLNKEAEESVVYNKLINYNKRCTGAISDCYSTYNSICQSNRCVPSND